ncbi:MAG: RNA methyltransferase, partial [Actinomycetota bacterium]|nr:RNA methyltransferase [Actinomycetota bacterium]
MSTYDGKWHLEISSPANPRVKRLVSLRKRRVRDAEGVTLLEGYDELLLALGAGAVPRTVFHCPALAGRSDPDAMLERVTMSGSEIVRLSAAAFAKASYREGPDGWLAVVADPAVA